MRQTRVRYLPVRQPASAFVIAHEQVTAGDLVNPVFPDGTLPLVFEVIHPVGRFDERRTVTDGRIRDTDAVARRAEADLLAEAALGSGWRRRSEGRSNASRTRHGRDEAIAHARTVSMYRWPVACSPNARRKVEML